MDASPIQTLTAAITVGLKLALQGDVAAGTEIISALHSEGVAMKHVFFHRTGKTVFCEEKNVPHKK